MPSTWVRRLVPIAFAATVGCGSAEAARPIAQPDTGQDELESERMGPTPRAPTTSTATARTPALTDGGAAADPEQPPLIDGGSPPASSSAAKAAPLEASASHGGQAASVATPLGAFDRYGLPKTKLALIMRADGALRAADAAALGRIWLDDSMFGKLCPGVPATERAELVSEQQQRRQRGAEAFAECLALADWSDAERLALNYGSNTHRVDSICAYDYLEHESSELFYVIGDTVYKVKIYDAVATAGGHALSGRIRCSKKRPGSATEAKRVMHRLGKTCPGVPWPRLTQIRGRCPRP